MDKETIRRKLKKRRSQLSDEFVKIASEIVCQKALDIFGSAHTFALYYPFKKELSLLPLFKNLRKLGKTVLFPKVVADKLVLIEAESLRDFAKGAFGIPEPEGEAFNGKVDVIFVPAVAFDLNFNRLGMGKGYYDRLLKGLSALKVGVCYDFQILPKLPAEPHDVPVDFILTEKRAIGRKR